MSDHGWNQLFLYMGTLLGVYINWNSFFVKFTNECNRFFNNWYLCFYEQLKCIFKFVFFVNILWALCSFYSIGLRLKLRLKSNIEIWKTLYHQLKPIFEQLRRSKPTLYQQKGSKGSSTPAASSRSLQKQPSTVLLQTVPWCS